MEALQNCVNKSLQNVQILLDAEKYGVQQIECRRKFEEEMLKLKMTQAKGRQKFCEEMLKLKAESKEKGVKFPAVWKETVAKCPVLPSGFTNSSPKNHLSHYFYLIEQNQRISNWLAGVFGKEFWTVISAKDNKFTKEDPDICVFLFSVRQIKALKIAINKKRARENGEESIPLEKGMTYRKWLSAKDVEMEFCEKATELQSSEVKELFELQAQIKKIKNREKELRKNILEKMLEKDMARIKYGSHVLQVGITTRTAVNKDEAVKLLAEFNRQGQYEEIFPMEQPVPKRRCLLPEKLQKSKEKGGLGPELFGKLQKIKNFKLILDPKPAKNKGELNIAV